MPGRYVSTDCPEDCQGCLCPFVHPPCGHCTDHYVEYVEEDNKCDHDWDGIDSGDKLTQVCLICGDVRTIGWN